MLSVFEPSRPLYLSSFEVNVLALAEAHRALDRDQVSERTPANT